MSPSSETRLAGYGVVRVSALPASALEDLRSPKLADLLTELAVLDRDWSRHAPRVAEAATSLVPELPDRKLRAEVLRTRRRLHRGAPVEADDLAVLVEHAVPGAPALAALAARRESLSALLPTEYDTSWSTEQQALADLARQAPLRAGAQLTADSLLHNIDRFADDVATGAGRDKRARTTEATLVNLVTRSILKPSPFGQLTHTRPVLLQSDVAPEPEPDQVRSVCRLPRQLVNWVERTLADHPALREHATLRRAPVVSASADTVSFLVRGRDGTAESALTERIVRLPRTETLAEVLRLPADDPVTRAELIRRCASTGGGEADVVGLQQAGVLAADLGLGEQDGDPLRALLRLLPGDCPEQLRDAVRALLDAETAFAGADPRQRGDLLAELRARIAALAGLCGVDLPPLEFARTLMYEDAVDPRPLAEPRARWESHLDTLAALHRVVPWFDDHAHTRATVAQVVEAMFGPGPHRLLTLYSALSVPRARNALIARLVDLHAPIPVALRQLQDQVLGMVDPGTPGDAEVVLDPARLRALADQPDWVSRWARVSWQVQRYAGEDGAERLVLNSSAIGYGRTISRFCYSFEAADAAAARFTETVRRELAEPDTAPIRSVDLSAVLGINANIHPALLPRYLRYPCGTPGGWPGAGISLEDCWARVHGGRLELTVGRDGPPLRLVPLNFLLNELAPQFYRFLSFFSTGSLANLGWWDRVDQRQPSTGADRGVRAYPRVRVGSVVVARRTWKLPPASLPAVAGQDGLAGYREIRRWQHDLGLPDLVFSRQFTLSDPLVPLEAEQRRRNARSLVQFPSSAARKPALVDFTSVTSVRAWQRTLSRVDDDLTLQECLPLPGAEVGRGGPDARVREYLLETVGGDDD
ncbi:hypothetical protein MCAG_03946 [Micromonospora sp. ATCC 39149]|uniref:Lantibiotic dehydratase n=1 Tax=Micromonospora carbonacea TaxID=47853 RepID=A0A7D5YHM9_9ACTN|nr:lantibiotic dehydratase [Micromonospora sp. ATCC 39149]EEP73619.1 hypothetical protein MCAG_03946 [Micromonospora sp. ATCC 39149]QLJ99536.1 lantibiotic dehydratase [Micromonospora carbonacea]